MEIMISRNSTNDSSGRFLFALTLIVFPFDIPGSVTDAISILTLWNHNTSKIISYTIISDTLIILFNYFNL